MDMKNLLSKISELQQLNESAVSEATKKTATGRVHTADPGGYGRKVDVDDEDDDKKGDSKKKKEPEVKRGRGRPPKSGAHTKDPAEIKKAKSREEAGKQLQSMIVGNKPAKSKGLEKLAKTKHTLKDWIEEINEHMLAEATAVPVPVIDPATKKPVLGTLQPLAVLQPIKN